MTGRGNLQESNVAILRVIHLRSVGNLLSMAISGVTLLFINLVVEATSPWARCSVVSWVVSSPRSPVSASLHLLALQLKPSLSGLRAPEHPPFSPSLLVLIQVTRWERKE